MCLFIVLLALAPLAAVAGENAPRPLADLSPSDIPLDEWRALASGRTVEYAIDGALWAQERYDPVGDRVILKFTDGTCLEGVWDHRRPFYCFHWEGDGTSCFRHVRAGSRILVLESEGGALTGAAQVVAGITDAPISCNGPVIF